MKQKSLTAMQRWLVAVVLTVTLIVANVFPMNAYAASNGKQTGTTYEIEVGETIVLPILDGDTTFKSSDTKVAIVTTDGEVTGVGTGTAVITATSKYGSGFFWFFGWGNKMTTKYTIIVKDSHGINPDPGAPEDAQHIKVGETLTLTVEGSNVSWTSSDDNIAKVSKKGVVTGVLRERQLSQPQLRQQPVRAVAFGDGFLAIRNLLHLRLQSNLRLL